MTELNRLLQLIEQAEEKFPTMGNLVFKMTVEEYVADYLLENNVIPLELKPGDTVYIKGKAVKISYVYIGDEVFYCIHQRCYDTHCHDCPLYYIGDENCDGYFEFKAEDVGKTVFLTKECKNA